MNKLYIYILWKKLLKLVIPGVVIVYMLMKFNFIQISDFYNQTGSYEIGNKYFNFEPTLLSVLEDVLYKVLFLGKGIYNGPLWTLFAEFWGSAIVYYTANLLKSYNVKNKKLIYSLIYLILLPFDYNISTVVLGALVFDALFYLDSDKTFLGRLVSFIFSKKWTLIIFYIVGMYLATINEFGIGLWSPISSLVRGFPILRGIGMAILFFALYRSESIQKIFSNKVLLWLGARSAYIYIFHWPLIVSIGLYIYLQFMIPFGLAGKFLVAIFIIFISIIFADVYYRIMKNIGKK